jgi:hypothetical protein
MEVEIMPKVTLLAEKWQDRLMPYGKSSYHFRGGEPKEVPTAVALFCKGKTNSNGEKLFKVEGLENIITPESASPVPKQNVEKEKTSVLGSFTQLRLVRAELCH